MVETFTVNDADAFSFFPSSESLELELELDWLLRWGFFFLDGGGRRRVGPEGS